jgi:hypothetical protein
MFDFLSLASLRLRIILISYTVICRPHACQLGFHVRLPFSSFSQAPHNFDLRPAGRNSVQPASCPFITLDRKLKVTAKSLRTWSDKQVGHIVSQLRLAKELLHKLEIAQDHRTLSPAECWLKNRLKKQSLLLASFKRTMARLRSRITRINEGDANTKFLHMHARYRKRKNLVTLLKDDDNIVTSHAAKADLVDQFYPILLASLSPGRIPLI